MRRRTGGQLHGQASGSPHVPVHGSLVFETQLPPAVRMHVPFGSGSGVGPGTRAAWAAGAAAKNSAPHSTTVPAATLAADTTSWMNLVGQTS